MPDPTRAQIHINSPLTDIAIAYGNEDYIANQVFPSVPVDKQSDYYFVWTKGFWLRNAVQRRAPGDTYPEGRIEVSSTTYMCKEFALGYGIPDEDVQNQDTAIQLEITGAEWLADQFQLNREIQIAADIFTTNVWANDVTGGTDFTVWSDYDDSNPMTDLITGMQTIQPSTGKKANTLVIGRQVFDQLAEHPMLLDKFKYTGAGILNNDEVRRALRVDRLIVGEAVYESTMEGDSTPTRSYIWGKHALLCHVPPSPGLRVAACGYTFEWKLPGAGGATVAIGNSREDWRDRDFLKGKHAFDDKVTATDLGYFFSGAVA